MLFLSKFDKNYKRFGMSGFFVEIIWKVKFCILYWFGVKYKC